MRNRILPVVGVALALSLSASAASHADARRMPARGISRQLAPAQPLSVSGMFSGALGGEIQLDGVSFRLAKSAVIYDTASGVMVPGTVVRDRMITVSGMQRGDSFVVTMITVRPAADTATLTGDMSRFVREKSESTPR